MKFQDQVPRWSNICRSGRVDRVPKEDWQGTESWEHSGESKPIKATESYFKRKRTVNFVKWCSKEEKNDKEGMSTGFSNMTVLMVFTKRSFSGVKRCKPDAVGWRVMGRWGSGAYMPRPVFLETWLWMRVGKGHNELFTKFWNIRARGTT